MCKRSINLQKTVDEPKKLWVWNDLTVLNSPISLTDTLEASPTMFIIAGLNFSRLKDVLNKPTLEINGQCFEWNKVYECMYIDSILFLYRAGRTGVRSCPWVMGQWTDKEILQTVHLKTGKEWKWQFEKILVIHDLVIPMWLNIIKLWMGFC